MHMTLALVAGGATVVATAALLGCSSPGGDATTTAAAGASESASPSAPAAAAPSASSGPKAPKEPKPPWIGVEGPVAQIESVLDPKKVGPYAGPKATLRGTITIRGDAPPDAATSFSKDCPLAANMYGKLFRVGDKGTLADALVAVTGFDGFVPAKSDAVEVTVNGCAFGTRTVALALGQRLDVRNVDREVAYTPFLDGSEYSAMRVAIPKGPLVPLSARKPGQYLLRDAMQRPFMLADVYVLKYATTAVTKIDGAYEITGLPVGKVRVDALLPVIRKAKGKEIELVEGDNVVDLELTYDAKKDEPVPVPAPAFGTRTQPAPPAGSAGSAPASSGAAPGTAPSAAPP